MKTSILFLISFLVCLNLNAQRSSFNGADNPREDRKFAITSEGGWKTMSGTGINATYYVMPQLGLDAGVGFSTQGLRTGLRARYLFLDGAFSPIIGLGANVSHGTFTRSFEQEIDEFEIDGQVIESFVAEVNLQLRRTVAAQILTGIEYMSEGGFVVGFNLGYRVKLNQSWDTEFVIDGRTYDVGDRIINTLDRISGSGFSIALNLGYAF